MAGAAQNRGAFIRGFTPASKSPRRWALPKLAAAWAGIVLLGAMVVLSVPPVHNWSHSDQIMVVQIAVTIGGGVAGVVALFSAALQLAELTAVESISIDPAVLIMPYRETGSSASEFTVRIANYGPGIPRVWVLEVESLDPRVQLTKRWKEDQFDTSTELGFQRIVCAREQPMFPGLAIPIGPVYVTHDQPSDMRMSHEPLSVLRLKLTTPSGTWRQLLELYAVRED